MVWLLVCDVGCKPFAVLARGVLPCSIKTYIMLYKAAQRRHSVYFKSCTIKMILKSFLKVKLWQCLFKMPIWHTTVSVLVSPVVCFAPLVCLSPSSVCHCLSSPPPLSFAPLPPADAARMTSPAPWDTHAHVTAKQKLQDGHLNQIKKIPIFPLYTTTMELKGRNQGLIKV